MRIVYCRWLCALFIVLPLMIYGLNIIVDALINGEIRGKGRRLHRLGVDDVVFWATVIYYFFYASLLSYIFVFLIFGKKEDMDDDQDS